MGEEKLVAPIQESLNAATRTGAAKPSDLTKVIVDATAQPKAVAFPTDAKLMHRARERLVRLAKKASLPSPSAALTAARKRRVRNRPLTKDLNIYSRVRKLRSGHQLLRKRRRLFRFEKPSPCERFHVCGLQSTLGRDKTREGRNNWRPQDSLAVATSRRLNRNGNRHFNAAWPHVKTRPSATASN